MPALAQAPTDRKPFSPEELDQMLAPIALYDDALLSQVLMAASYPLEIVEAARWSQANPNLKGDAAVKAVADKTWDVSVKSLVAFPSILKQLSDHLDWTQKLGDAMIGQQADVATSIQRLRAKASAAGTLKTGKEQTVTTQTQGSETIIAIQPTNPEVVYVPTYDPNTAYGQWPNPSYPPTYYPTYPMGGALMTGLMWGVGIAAAGAMFSGWNWGYGGSGSYVNVNANRATNIDRNYNRGNVGAGGRWQHDGEPSQAASATVIRNASTIRTEPSRRRSATAVSRTARRASWRPGGVGGPGGAGVPVASAVPAVSVARVALVASAVPAVSAERVALAASVVPAVSVARVALAASVVPAVSVARVALAASVVPAVSVARVARWHGGGRAPAAAAPTDCPA